MKTNKDSSRSVLAVLTKLVDHDIWDKTFILRASKKKILHLIGEIRTDIKNSELKVAEVAKQAEKKEVVLTDDMMVVYILLYQTKDTSLKGWADMFKILSRAVYCRPIYSKEKDVQAILGGFLKAQEGAYIAIVINKADILSVPEKMVARDKRDVPLITLEDNAIDLKNLKYFVHLESKYTYRDAANFLL